MGSCLEEHIRTRLIWNLVRIVAAVILDIERAKVLIEREGSLMSIAYFIHSKLVNVNCLKQIAFITWMIIWTKHRGADNWLLILLSHLLINSFE